MKDLIYDSAARTEFLKRYPDAKIEDASDFIHDSRFSVEFEETDKYEYLHWLVDNGLAEISMKFQLWFQGEFQDAKPYLEKWLGLPQTEPKPEPKQYKLNHVGIRILD